MKSPELHAVEILEDIWFEILARVPIVVVKLRCLSKFHRNLINSSAFIKKHSETKRSSPRTPTYCITPSENENRLLTDYFVKKLDPTNDVNPTAVVQRPKYPPHNSYKCVGSCKGILLLRSPENTMLWNPLTGASRTFPKVNGISYQSLSFFLGHDETTDDLKIVKMMHKMRYRRIFFPGLYDDPDYRGKCECEIYSSKTGTWRRKVIQADHSLRLANHVGVFVDGTNSIHMIGKEDEAFVVAFDFSTENFRRIRLPTKQQWNDEYNIWNLDGYLCIYTNKCRSLSVFVMREYGNEESWDHILRIDKLTYGNVKPVQVMNDGRQWLLLSDEGVLFYDLDKEKKKVVCLEKKMDRSRFRFRPLGFEYTPSLRRV